MFSNEPIRCIALNILEILKMIPAYSVISSALLASLAHGHGEDKLGPHGGFIRMPGVFHTELVPDGTNGLKVYLLDVNWKNPSVKDSSVKIRYGKKGELAKCEAKEELYYSCRFSGKVDVTKMGLLSVTSTREKQKGNEVTYPLPLKLVDYDKEHEGHH